MHKTFPTLYKVDNKGKVREWEVEVSTHGALGSTVAIQVIHGAQNGAKQIKDTYIRNGKNIGKANETTALEQAYLEAESKWNKQKDKGYSETIVAKSERSFRPMLAQEYVKHSKKIVFPCYVQPKLDGLRCSISLENGKAVARSRNGKEWKVLNHITEMFEPILKQLPNIIPDGELFTRKVDFQKIISGIKRDEPNEYTSMIEFWCYDVHVVGKQIPFSTRMHIIKDIADLIPIVPVETKLAKTHDEIWEFHEEYTGQGYEGVMARNAAGLYEVDKRSYHLLKVKAFQDQEFEIVDISLDKNNECVFTCVTDENKRFDVKCKGSTEHRQALYDDQNIGKLLTVKFFEWTNDGVPRFPVGKGLRDYE